MENAVILMTGGMGLVGKALQHIIETEPAGSRYGKLPNETWIFAGSSEGDLRDSEQTCKLYEKYKLTHVIHLAALVGGLFKNMKYKLTFLRDNLLINDDVLHTSYTHKTIKLISCLLTCVFPQEVEYPLDESKIHGGHRTRVTLVTPMRNLVAMLFVAVAAAVPTDMLKREVKSCISHFTKNSNVLTHSSPAVPLNRRAEASFIAMPSVPLFIVDTVPSRLATALGTLVLVGITKFIV
ncbi:hypothetical protein C8J57DRAFT_1506045 [Mycena rebaudengoi]|nr:hypothetical protein C8J57DRAFT_1506045 [Mycena rebaudengoi]